MSRKTTTLLLVVILLAFTLTALSSLIKSREIGFGNEFDGNFGNLGHRYAIEPKQLPRLTTGLCAGSMIRAPFDYQIGGWPKTYTYIVPDGTDSCENTAGTTIYPLIFLVDFIFYASIIGLCTYEINKVVTQHKK